VEGDKETEEVVTCSKPRDSWEKLLDNISRLLSLRLSVNKYPEDTDVYVLLLLLFLWGNQ